MATYDDPYASGGTSRLTNYLDNTPALPGPSRLTRSLDQITASRVSLLDRLSQGERVDPREIQQQDVEAIDSSTEFGKGLRRFGYSAAATVKASTGQLLENFAPETGRALMRDAQQTVTNMPRSLAPEFNTFADAKAAGLRGLGSYAASALGEGLPSLAATGAGMLLGGGAGALAGRAALGRVAGGVAASLPMEAGEVALDIQNDPRATANTTPAERTALMLGRGGLNAALETVVPEALIVPRLLGKAGRVAPGIAPALGNVAATGLAGGVGEFGTEAAQDLTGQAALNIARGDPIGNVDLAQAGEAGIRGALPGSVIGGVAGGVQSLYSNVGAAGDKARDAARKNGFTLDNIIGGIANASANPREAGARLTNMTLDQLSKTPEFLSEARKQGLKGVDTGADFVAGLKRQADQFIAENVSPENREWYARRAANLNTATAMDWNNFRSALEAETGRQFLNDLTFFGTQTGKRAAQNAGSAWGWLTEFSKGVASAAKNRGTDDAKQSAVIPSPNQRKALLESIASVSPDLREQIFGKNATSEDRVKLASLISNQLAQGGMTYYDDENLQRDPQRKAFLDNWETTTGTDFRKVMQAAQAGLNNVDQNEITSKWLPPELRPGGDDPLAGQLDRASILRNEDDSTASETDFGSDAIDSGADGSMIEIDGERDLRVKESILAGERSPFDEKVFRNTLVQEKYKSDPKYANTRVDVEIEIDPDTLPEGVTLSNAQIANVLGGKRVGQQKFEPYADDEVNSDGPLKLRVNPMSTAVTVRGPDFRDRFTPYIGTFDEMEGMTENAKRGRAFAGALGALAENGIEIDPQAFGLPEGPPIRLKVNADLAKIKDSLVINREVGVDGKSKNVTLRNIKAESAKPLPGPSRRLFEKIREDYTNEFTTRAEIEELADFIEKGADPNNIPASSPTRNVRTLKKIDPNALREMIDDIDIGREDFMDALTGRVVTGDTPDAEFEAVAKQSTTEYERATDRLTEKRQRNVSASAPSLDISLRESKFAGDITAAKTQIRLRNIGNQIGKAKRGLDEPALARLREQYAAKMAELQRSNAPAGPVETTAGVGSPPPPPPPPPPGGSNGDPPPRRSLHSPPSALALPSGDAQKRFLKVVERVMGKRVRVEFEQALNSGAAETVARSKRERLDQLGNLRRTLLADRSKAELENEKAAIDKNIARIEEEERKVDRDEAVLGIIRVATGREAQAGLAEHEVFHAAFSIFFTPEERRVITTAFTQGLVARRLREIFKDDPDVLAAIERDPEEAAAYAFQIWARDPEMLKLGQQVDNLFTKFLKWVRNLFGVLTYEERAELLLNDLTSGRRAEQGTSPVAKILDKDQPWSKRAQKYAQDIYDLAQKGHDIVLGSVYGRLIDTANPLIAKIARAGYQPTGEEGGAGMVQRAMTEVKRFNNRLDTIFRGLNEEELKALQDAKVANVRPENTKLAARYDVLSQFYDDMYKYQTEAGVDLGDRGTGGSYYPLTWDPEKVLKNKAEFLKMLEPYAEQLRETKKTPLEIWQSITEYLERGDELNNVMGQNNEPLSDSSRVRSLDFISREDRRQFMVDDPTETAARYVRQAVRQTEFVRAFGMNGSKLNAWKAEAMERYGASTDEMALVNDYIDGLMGNKEIGMSRELKDLYGALTVYQNIRLLPFSLLNSLVDPLGIAVRSNSMGDAWGVFTYSLKNMFRDWKSAYTPDQWEQIAVDYGIVERSGTSINADNLYTGITLRGTTKKINDAFFKYNLLNGWIRNNTIAAVKMSQRFMYRSSQNFFGEEQSKRYLDELGLVAEDIVLGPDGERILIHKDELMAAGKSEQEAEAAAERIRQATDQFVRQSLLNPNAAELPNWASNPYFMPIAHLKSFVFGFNRTIIDRVQREMENDNFKPLLVASAYVPGMIAATFLKDMASGFGEEPPYKKDWGVADYLQEGVAKSGLTGTGQFFMDMQQDIQYGGRGYESLAGPTLGQLQKGLKTITTGDGDDVQRFFVKALPANPVYDQWLLPGY